MDISDDAGRATLLNAMSQYTDYLVEVFSALGHIQIRRMFGGHGVFHDGLMIGLVADDVLYLKADGDSVHEFSARGLPQFVYNKRGTPTGMSYYQAPEEIFDDPDEATHWGKLAYDAALRSKKPKRKRKKT